jgi:nucleoside-diphosphate-sugar epimerase
MSDAPTAVLVTGAAGMVGRATLDLLAKAGVHVCALDRRDPGDLRADRVIVGAADDPGTVRKALSGVSSVIHLAARPDPRHGTPIQVYAGNTNSTFAVLSEAAAAGVTRVAVAGSYSVTGLPFGPPEARPAYLPVDEAMPVRPVDPYALSKQADEATAAMVHRASGMTITVLRFPFLGDPGQRLAERAALYTADPAAGAREVWAYLDTRDAARACWAAVTVAPPGCHVVFAAAPETLAPYPTAELADAFLPGVPRNARLPGRIAPLDVSAAARILGFRARHHFPLATLSLPQPAVKDRDIA